MSVLQSFLCRFTSPVNLLINKGLFTNCFARNIATSACHLKIKIEEKLGIKPKPKRPPTAFLRYVVKVKPSILQQHPDFTVKDINILAGQKWKKETDEVKNQLQIEYQADWDKYQGLLKEYDKSLSPGEREEIKMAAIQLKQAKEKKLLKKEADALGKPKKPGSSYVLFFKSKLGSRGNLPFREFQKKISKEWQKIDKQKYVDEYHKDLEVYKNKLAAWEREMSKKGRHELVRRRI